MDVESLLNLISKINLNTDEDTYFLQIINAMSEAAEVAINSLVYEIITLDNNSIQNICNRLKDTFPDINVTVNEKRIYIDWS